MRDKPTVWDTLTLGLWAFFFALGLAPELAFHLLRDMAGVSYFTAIVNSSFFISITLTGYFSWFVYQRCMEAGQRSSHAVGMGIQSGILAMVAFMDLPSKRSTFESHTIVELIFQLGAMPDLYVKSVVVLVVVCKLAIWWYLYSLVFRYHAFGNRNVFAGIPSFIPSAHQDVPKDNDGGAATEELGAGKPD